MTGPYGTSADDGQLLSASSGGYGGGGYGGPPGGPPGGGYGGPPGSPPGGGGGGYGGPPGGYSSPPPAGPPQGGYGPPMSGQDNSPSGMAIAALVLGVLTWMMGFSLLTAIPGMIVGWIEMGKVKRGESGKDGKWMAQVGFWASAVHVLLFVLLGCAFGLMLGIGAVAGA